MRISLIWLVMFATAVARGQSESDKKPADKRAAASPDKEGSSTEAAKPDAGVKTDKVVRTEKEWRKLLTREQFRVLRMKGTERPFTNKYDHHFEPGTYACAACGQELFNADTKFDSGCGWPAFYAAKAGDRVIMTRDLSQGMVRTEVTCARCGSHLGHIFDDAPQTPTGQRFCINSVSLKFIPAAANKKDPEEQSEDRHKPNKEKERKRLPESSRRSS